MAGYRVTVGEPEGGISVGTATLSGILTYRMGLDSSGSGLGQAAGCCWHGNEHSVTTKCGAFLDLLRNYWFIHQDSAPCSLPVCFLPGEISDTSASLCTAHLSPPPNAITKFTRKMIFTSAVE